jgi:peptidoglycan/LPS O-acetylase OafA/YrhL
MATDLLFPMYGFYFALGLVFGFHMAACKRWLAENRRLLALSTLSLAVASVAVVEIAFHLTGIRRGAGPNTIVASLFSVAFILVFLAFSDVKMPFSNLFYQLGRASYGIYLLHAVLLEVAARSIQEFTPGLLAYQVILLLVLTSLAIGIALAFMTAVARSPARRSYRYLFG